MKHFDLARAVPQQAAPGGFRTGPERIFPIQPMNPPLLPSAKHAQRPRIKGFPNRPQNLMHVRNTIGSRPPGREPWNPMMLIHDQIKRLLFAKPLNCLEDRLPSASTANDRDSVYDLLRAAAWKFISKPINLVPSPLQ